MSWTTPGFNLVGELNARLKGDLKPGSMFRVELRRHPAAFVDATLFVDGHSESRPFPGNLAGLGRWEAIASLRELDHRVTLRFSDGILERVGRSLEDGDCLGLVPRDTCAGTRCLVDYADPNLTKALHVGHLRNILVGHALASTLRICGADVRTQAVACDMGRNVCEAMAGYREHFPQATPEGCGLRPDRFVGECYRKYVESSNAAPLEGEDLNAPILRELHRRQDSAQELFDEWRKGSPEVLALWEKVTRWALAGQNETLRRLGASVDSWIFESTTFPRAQEFARAATEGGLLERAADQSVSYATRLKEYAQLPLLRSDGYPTEHLRALMIWGDLARSLDDDERVYHVMGDEWKTATAVRLDMLRALYNPPWLKHYRMISHAMVLVENSKMKSSAGEAVHIDDCWETVRCSDQLRSMVGPSASPELVEEAARIVMSLFFLSRPLGREIPFSVAHLLDSRENRGWDVARAWFQCGSRCADGLARGRMSPEYRYVVLQSQRVPSILNATMESGDPSDAVQFAIHLANVVLKSAAPASDAVAATVLRILLAALGLVRVA